MKYRRTQDMDAADEGLLASALKAELLAHRLENLLDGRDGVVVQLHRDFLEKVKESMFDMGRATKDLHQQIRKFVDETEASRKRTE